MDVWKVALVALQLPISLSKHFITVMNANNSHSYHFHETYFSRRKQQTTSDLEDFGHRHAIRKNGTRQTMRQQITETGRWLKAMPVGLLQSLASHWLLNFSINLCLPAWLHPHSKGAVLSQMHLNLSYWRQVRRPGPFGQHAPKWAILTSIWEIGEKWY